MSLQKIVDAAFYFFITHSSSMIQVGYIIPVSLIRELELREVKQRSQRHMVSRGSRIHIHVFNG